MEVAFFSTRNFEREFFEKHNKPHGHYLVFFEQRLTEQTACLAAGHQAFFTGNALENIAAATVANITDFEQRRPCINEIGLDLIRR